MEDPVLQKALAQSQREEAERQERLVEQEELQIVAALENSLKEFKSNEGWDCEFCTFANQWSSRVCEMCQAPMPVHFQAQAQAQAQAQPQGRPHGYSAPGPVVHAPPVNAAQRMNTMKFEVPTIEGTLSTRILGAKELTDKAKIGKMNPFVEMRILQKSYRGPLRVTVHGATKLRDTQIMGKMDPYVIVSLNKKEFRSVTHRNGHKQPTWNQQFLFPLEGRQDERFLRFRVMNKNPVSDDDVGYALISIEALVKMAGRGQRTFRLCHPSKPHKEAGEILLTVAHDPQLQPHSYQQIMQQKTQVAKGGGVAPSWNQTIDLANLSSDVAVHFTVWDKGVMGTRFVGQTEIIPLKNAILQNFFSRGQNSWYKLIPRSMSKEKVSGEVQVVLHFTNPDYPYGLGPVQLDAEAPPIYHDEPAAKPLQPHPIYYYPSPHVMQQQPQVQAIQANPAQAAYGQAPPPSYGEAPPPYAQPAAVHAPPPAYVPNHGAAGPAQVAQPAADAGYQARYPVVRPFPVLLPDYVEEGVPAAAPADSQATDATPSAPPPISL